MRTFWKKYFGPVYILFITAVVAGILISNHELGMIMDALKSLRAHWVWMAAGCIAVYLLLRMAQLKYYLARRGYRISWMQAAEVTGAGQFYSAITPSASGGQPMQLLHLHRMGVPVSTGTACISVKFLGFQTGYLLIGGLMLLFRRGMIGQQLADFGWLVALGFVVNAALIAAVLLTIPRTKILERMIRWLIRVGERLHIVKDGKSALESFQNMLADYRDALVQLLRSPLDAFVMFALSIAQVIVYMCVIVCIYRAFGLASVQSVDLFAIQLALFIAAAFIPLPGAAGAQESGFCAFFAGIFPEASMIPAMLCWRFFSYYLLLGMGLAMMILPRMRIGKRNSGKSEIDY